MSDDSHTNKLLMFNGLSDEKISYVKASVNESLVLGRSDRQASLFGYLLKALGKREGHDVTEKSIAAELFGQNEDFDPKRNSAVRSDLYRLRRNLEQFNAQYSSQYGFELYIPKKTYRVGIHWQSQSIHSVVATQAETQKKTSKRLMVRGIFLVVVVALLALSLQYFSPLLFNKPIQGLVAPIVSVTYESLGNAPNSHKGKSLESLRRLLTYKASSSNQVNMSESASPFYSVNLVAENDLGSRFIIVTLSDRLGGILWSKRYPLQDVDATVGMELMASEMARDLFSHYGVIASQYRLDTSVSIKKRQLYNCWWNLEFLYLVEEDIDSIFKELYACLDPAQTANPKDKSTNLLLRIYLLLWQHNGRAHVGVQKPLMLADKMLHQVDYYGQKTANYYKTAIILEKSKPILNYERIRYLVSNMEQLYPHDLGAYLIALRTYAIALGDWKAVKEMRTRPLYSIAVDLEYDYGLLGEETARGNFAAIKQHLGGKLQGRLSYLQSWRVAVYCALGDEGAFDDEIIALRRLGIHSRDGYVEYIKRGRNFVDIERNLLKAVEACEW